jgi:hypothetical protein
MIVIEKNNPLSETIGNTIIGSNMQAIGWDSFKVPLYKMLSDVRPNLIIYGQQANVNGIGYIKQKYPSTALVYIGEYPADEVVADIVVGESDTRKSISLPKKIYDITNITKGNKRDHLQCRLASFTDSMKEQTVQSFSEVLVQLFHEGARFFGKVKLDAYPYLGLVTDQERADIVSSCDVYVDITSDYWYKSIIMGTIPIVLSENKIPGLNTFNDKATLLKALDSVSNGEYDIQAATEEIRTNSGFSFCATLFSALGADDAVQSILKSKEAIL